MAFVYSNWKIIFDPSGTPFTLVSWGNEIDEELGFPWAQAVDTSKRCRAAGAKKFGRGRVETAFTLGVWKTHDSHALARNYMLDQLAVIPTGVSSNLRIYVKDGNTYNLADAVIASGEPRMTRAVGVIRTWQQFKVEGGQFTIV